MFVCMCACMYVYMPVPHARGHCVGAGQAVAEHGLRPQVAACQPEQRQHACACVYIKYVCRYIYRDIHVHIYYVSVHTCIHHTYCIHTYIRTHTRAKSDPQVSTQGSVRQESNCASRSSSSSSAIWHTGRAARAARRKAPRCGGAEVDVHQMCESIRHARAPDTQEHQTRKSITYARASNTHRDRQGVGGRGEIEEGDLGGLHAPVPHAPGHCE